MTKDLPAVDVVICVHNALEDVQRCLEALRRTDYPAGRLRVILVDDGSDKPTAELLRGFAMEGAEVVLERRDKAGGYTVAANTGVAAARGDLVVLLNSDTIVPAAWLRKLARIFAHSPDIGIVGPMSNAASWQTIPERAAPTGGWAVNDLPEGMSVDDMDALVEEVAQAVPVIPRITLLNGFCYAVRREVFDTIGAFDDVGFPFGFGEEDDFSLRAANAGFGLALAVDTYVFHAKSKSYGSAKRTNLTDAGQERLRLKHGRGRLNRAVETMRGNPYIEIMRTELAAALAARDLPVVPA